MRTRRSSANPWGVKLAGGAVLLACLAPLLSPSFPLPADPSAPKRVLALYHFGRDYPTSLALDQGLQTTLRTAPTGPVEYYAEYLESDRFSEISQFPVMRDYLRRKYADRRIDVVIAASH